MQICSGTSTSELVQSNPTIATQGINQKKAKFIITKNKNVLKHKSLKLETNYEKDLNKIT